MKQFLFILAFLCFALPAVAEEERQLSPAATEMKLREILNDDIKDAAKPLNSKLDYMADAYSDGELRALIKNYEMTNRKLAARQGKAYVPYDRKIDVNDPAKVKRYFRKRIDIIF